MRNLASILAVVVLALTGTACSGAQPPAPSTRQSQVDALVADLSKAGLVIDEVEDKSAKGGKRNNAHFEQETEAKTRKVIRCSDPTKKQTCKTETTKITTKQFVAEVTVVVSGNCKAQIERLLDVGSTSYYFDETWDERDNEIPVETDSPYSFMPAPATLVTYFSDLGPQQQTFAFCRGKDKKLSPAGRN